MYKSGSQKARKAFMKQWCKDRNFDFAKHEKVHDETHKNKTRVHRKWLTEPQVMAHEGYTKSNPDKNALKTRSREWSRA